MRLSREDLRRLRTSALLAAAMIAAGAVTVSLTSHWMSAEEQATRQALAKRDEMRTKLARAREEQTEIQNNIVRFNELAARGIIGNERRLDWLDRIKEVEAVRRLHEVKFELSAQQPMDATLAPGASGGFDFMSSSMRLELPLVHEKDLLDLVGDLTQTVSAVLRPRQCAIERLESTGGNAPLRATCTIDWITLRDRDSR